MGAKKDEILILGESTIKIDHINHIISTHFNDGTSVELWSDRCPNGQQDAETLGYYPPFTPWDHFREHDILHTWLALKMGYRVSPTLWTVSHSNANKLHYGMVTKKAQGMEEHFVTQFQKFLNIGIYDDWSKHWLLERGYHLDNLRSEALHFLRS
jgi:hypothetical protein